MNSENQNEQRYRSVQNDEYPGIWTQEKLLQL